jgi:hypothetical protein
MSISSQTARSTFTLATKPQTLTIPWYFLASGDIKIVKTSTAGVDSAATLTTHYTVTGAGVESGGTVVIANNSFWTVGDTVTVYRAGQVVQPAEYPVNGQFPSATAETSADRTTMLIQQLKLDVDRSVRIATTGAAIDPMSLADRKSKFIGFDANGNLALSAATVVTTGLQAANNLSDVANASASRVNIGAAWSGVILDKTNNLSDLDNVITAKTNLRLTVVNVKDYGAIGDGTTNDTTAINLAIAALTNYSALYFPNGNYKITSALTTIASKSNVKIYGDGARIFSTVTGAAGNTFEVSSSSSHIHFSGLSFVGSATTRGNGIHIRLYSSYSSVTNCYFSGCSDFAILVSNDASAYNIGTRIEDNTIVAPLGDGIHAGNASDFLISGNTLINTGDDSIGVIADTAAYPPLRGTVVGNHIYNSSSAGIRICEVNDLQVIGNHVHTTVAAGIEVNRYLSTTAYNNRITVKSNKLYNTQTSAGPRGSIWMNFCNDSSVTDNDIHAPANGAGIAFLDFNKLSIIGNTIAGAPSRAIASDDTTTTDVAANWYSLVIQDNIIQSVTANEAIYVIPAVAKTVNNVLITSNTGNALPSGNWIYYARVTTGVIANNTSRDNRTVANGGTVSGVIEYNNTLWPKLGIGTAPTADSDLVVAHSVPASNASAAVLVQGSMAAPVATDLHPNAFRDATTFTATVNADAYASFDALTGLAGTVNYNHYRGFQFRGSFSGSGTLDNISGFHNETTVSSGTVSAIKMFHCVKPQITGGTVSNVYGLYVDDLVTAGTARYAIYTNGTAPWFSAGGQVYTSALLTTPAGASSVRMGATFDQATQTGMAVMNSSATATGTMIGFYNSGGTYQGGVLQTNSTTISYATSSDKRLKDNVRDMNDSGTIIDAMLPRIYDWKWGGKDCHGFIAQELYASFPEAVTKGDDNEEIKDCWSIDYSKLTPLLVAEVKDLRLRIAKLELSNSK